MAAVERKWGMTFVWSQTFLKKAAIGHEAREDCDASVLEGRTSGSSNRCLRFFRCGSLVGEEMLKEEA